MADDDITPLVAAERAMWGAVAEAQSYVELLGRVNEPNPLAEGLLTRLCEAVEEYTRLLAGGVQ